MLRLITYTLPSSDKSSAGFHNIRADIYIHVSLQTKSKDSYICSQCNNWTQHTLWRILFEHQFPTHSIFFVATNYIAFFFVDSSSCLSTMLSQWTPVLTQPGPTGTEQYTELCSQNWWIECVVLLLNTMSAQKKSELYIIKHIAHANAVAIRSGLSSLWNTAETGRAQDQLVGSATGAFAASSWRNTCSPSIGCNSILKLHPLVTTIYVCIYIFFLILSVTWV